MKKAISLVLSLLMLVALVVPVSAATEAQIISNEVLDSVTEEEDTGLGLAFLYTMSMNDVAIIGNRTFKSATVTIDGVDYDVVTMGALVTNMDETGKDAEAMVRENANGKKLLDVEGKKLWDGWTDTQLQFAVRVTKIPVDNKKTNLYARPYYVYEKGGEEITVYGDISNKSYFSGWCDANPVELPAVGTSVDAEDIIAVSKAEIVERTVTLTLINTDSDYTIAKNSTVDCVCYDKDGNALETATLNVDAVNTVGKAFTFEVPDDTALVAFGDANTSYMILPAIGTDIDVTKKKNRIRVSAAAFEGHTVTLTFKNYTSNWITEETDFVQYTCYDAAGKKIDATPKDDATTVGTIYIGCIDTKKNKEKSFTFEVPENTAKVKLTKSDITYWTEWA